MKRYTVEKISKFIKVRDWGKFHTNENIAKSICIESAELLECFQWGDVADTNTYIDELADVLTYAYIMCINNNLDPDEIVLNKLDRTDKKYPVDKFYGSSRKYNK